MINIKIHQINIKRNNDGFIGSYGYNGFTSALPANDYKYDYMTENTNAIAFCCNTDTIFKANNAIYKSSDLFKKRRFIWMPRYTFKAGQHSTSGCSILFTGTKLVFLKAQTTLHFTFLYGL